MHKSSLFLQREYNAGIPGMLISTSCVFNPSLGRTSCLMRLRSSLTHADWVMMPVKTSMHSPIWPWPWQWKAKGRWSDVFFSSIPCFFSCSAPKKQSHSSQSPSEVYCSPEGEEALSEWPNEGTCDRFILIFISEKRKEQIEDKHGCW